MDSTRFWQYSLDKYGIDEVKDTCLALQDSYGYNVNLLLFCMLCDKQKRSLSIKVIAQIMRVIENSDAELNEHRIQRKNKKAGCEISATPTCMDDYEAMLKHELSLEAKQQEIIAGIFATLNANESSVEQIGSRILEKQLQTHLDTETEPYDSSLQSYLTLMSKSPVTKAKKVNSEQQQFIDALREHV